MEKEISIGVLRSIVQLSQWRTLGLEAYRKLFEEQLGVQRLRKADVNYLNEAAFWAGEIASELLRTRFQLKQHQPKTHELEAENERLRKQLETQKQESKTQRNELRSEIRRLKRQLEQKQGEPKPKQPRRSLEMPSLIIHTKIPREWEGSHGEQYQLVWHAAELEANLNLPPSAELAQVHPLSA